MRRRAVIAALLILGGGASLLGGGAGPAQVGRAGGSPQDAVSGGGEVGPFLEEFRDGYIDWGAGTVAAWGRALNLAGDGRSWTVSSGRYAAETAARARLLAIVQSARATAEFRIGDRPDVVEKVEGIVRGGKVIRERERAQFLEVMVSAPLHGVEGILYSISEVVLPEVKRALATPPPAEAPEGRIAEAQPARPAPDAPTGIVIDARSAGVQPALLPRILDEAGKVIASPETVSAHALRNRGMAAYATQPGEVSLHRDRVGEAPLWVPASSGPSPLLPAVLPSAALSIDKFSERLGPRPGFIRALSASGTLKADIILGRAEAEALERSPDAPRLLKECRILVIVAAPAGRTEGGRGIRVPRGSRGPGGDPRGGNDGPLPAPSAGEPGSDARLRS